MSIYFQTTPAGVPDKTTPAKGVGASHESEPLLAFASAPGGRILICNEDGDTVHEIASSPTAPTAISFHPSRAVFAVGYRNGSFLVSGCNIENALTNSALAHLDQREQPQLHQGSQITAVSFGTSIVDEETLAKNSSRYAVSNQKAVANAAAGTTNNNNNNNNLNTAASSGSPTTTPSSSSGYDTLYFTTQEKILSAWSISTDSGTQVCTALWNSKLPSPVNVITRGNGFLFLHHNTSPNILVVDESAQTVSVGVTLDPKDIVGNPMRAAWDSKNRSLIVLTTTAHLISYKVGFDGKMNQTSFRKLNTSAITDTNILQLTYVSVGVIAVAAGDATIRIIAWNNNNNTAKLPNAAAENNNNNNQQQQSTSSSSSTSSLYFPDAAFGGATVATQQVVVSLGSSKQRGRLVAGNRAGQVAVWQFVGSQDSLDEFQLLAHVGAPPSAISSTSNQQPAAKNTANNNNNSAAASMNKADSLAVDRVFMTNTANGSVLILGAEYVQLLQGTVRQRKWQGRAMALQIAPNEVVVQNTSGHTFHVFPSNKPATTSVATSSPTSSSPPAATATATEQKKSQVRGIDIFWPNVLLWTGKSADVFTFVESSGAVTPVASFEQTLPAVALYSDGVLLTRGDKLQMTTFSKNANYSFSVSEAEGTPQVIHVADEVGAMATNKGSLRVFRIGARDLKPIGPSRQLRVPNGNVVANIGMMAINRTGKKVAFTTSATIAIPSANEEKNNNNNNTNNNNNNPLSLASSIFVHDVDTDSVFEFCFGEDRVPSFFSWNMSFVANFSSATSTSVSGATTANSLTANAGGNASSGIDAEAVLLAVETRIIKFSSSSNHHNAKTTSSNDNEDSDENSAKSPLGGGLTLMNATTQYLPASFQYQQQGGGGGGGNNNNNENASGFVAGGFSAPDRHVTTLFSSPRGVFHHHTFPLHPQQSGLIGCSVPHLVLGIQLEAELDDDEEFSTEKSLSASVVNATTGSKRYEHSLFLKPLRDFDGMQQADSDLKLRTALMHFAYFAAIGNMDEAYKAVKLVKDPAIWVNMARMCVSTKRIDVAEVCLSNMQDTVAARAVRETRDEDVIDVRIAVLAMALGMVDDAERLLRKCKRFDLLTELYIACGRWDDAVANCEQHDRLRTTSVYFRHAHQAEDAGQFDVALQLYGRAKCLGTESPRLFFATNRVEELEAKITETDDRDLLMWWAQYLESRNDVEGALSCYKRARDGFNVIRLLVSRSQIDQAEDFLRESLSSTSTNLASKKNDNNNNNNNNKTPASPTTPPTTVAGSGNGVSAAGAAFFIARHYESQNNFTKSVQMYEQAAAFENAIRIAKDHEMFVDVLRISLKCGNNHTALESGRYFEERNMFDRAVQLYRQGGDNQRAIDVCIKGGLFDELHRISESLEQGADPETFIAMASHFEKSGHYNKAVEMLVFGKAFNEALQLCLDQNVKLTDAMAEAMTLPKTDNAEDEEYRLNLLRKIAKVAKDQDSYHLACKKYTQAGDIMKGVKALLKSGDTEKIIFFANHIRNNEVYFATANFLQSTDWAHDQVIFKSIVTFYTRSKQFESLALFYDTAAQHQIDENRSYEKAAGLLREGVKALEKGGDAINPQKRENLSRRVAAVDGFVRAMALMKLQQQQQQGGASNSNDNNHDNKAEPQSPKGSSEFVSICEDLISRSRPPHPDAELVRSAIRMGDIMAMLAEYYATSEQANKFQKAYQILEEMNRDGIQLNLFVEPALMKKIVDGAGSDVAPFTQIPDKQFERKASFKPKIKQDEVADDVEEDI